MELNGKSEREADKEAKEYPDVIFFQRNIF